MLNRAKELENIARESDEYIPEVIEEICNLAGLEDEYKEADGETFEKVLEKACYILGIDIWV